MSMKAITVSDTNIFLDLISVNLLAEFFALPCEIHTSDFVLNEISRQPQKETVRAFVAAQKLTVAQFGFSELSEIAKLQKNCGTNASFIDCSVWHYAKKIGARLLTGDSKLRRAAEHDGVLVSGILYVFDSLIECGILEKPIAAKKLQELADINPRLPRGECQSRIDAWGE